MVHGANVKIYEQSWRAEPTKCNAGGWFTLEPSRAFLNSRSSWTTAIPGASPAELEHTGTVSHCLWASLWAATAAHPLLTGDLPCFPHFNHPSLPKSTSQAFSAQTHHCPLQPPQASPGSVWSSWAPVALLPRARCSQVSSPGSPVLLSSCLCAAHPHQSLLGCSSPSAALI